MLKYVEGVRDECHSMGGWGVYECRPPTKTPLLQSPFLFGGDLWSENSVLVMRKSSNILFFGSLGPCHPYKPNALKLTVTFGAQLHGVGGTHDQPQMLHHFSSCVRDRLAFGSNTEITRFMKSCFFFLILGRSDRSIFNKTFRPGLVANFLDSPRYFYSPKIASKFS